MTLTSAFADLVACRSGFPAHELPEILAAPEDDGENDMCRDLVRLDAERLVEVFVSGGIQTYARPLGGGEVVALDPLLWEIDDPLPRFAVGVFHLERWADPDAPPTHRLFVDSEQFDRWLAALQPPERLTAREIDEVFDPQLRAARSVAARSVASQDLALSPPPAGNASGPIPGVGSPLLAVDQVCALVGQSRSTIYERTKAGTFPRNLKLGGSTRWKQSEVLAWIEEQAARRGA